MKGNGKLNRIDSWLLDGRDPDEPVGRLAVVRLRVLVAVALTIAILGVALMLISFQQANKRARELNIAQLTNDCVDRDGDVAFREVLAGLIKLNEHRPVPNAPRRSDQTIKVLKDGLKRAGPVPDCILKVQ